VQEILEDTYFFREAIMYSPARKFTLQDRALIAKALQVINQENFGLCVITGNV
jgi:hypothetical protein